MDVGATLVAHPQPAEPAQPPRGSLHHPAVHAPAVHAQPAAVLGAPPGPGRRDAAPPQFLASLSLARERGWGRRSWRR